MAKMLPFHISFFIPSTGWTKPSTYKRTENGEVSFFCNGEISHNRVYGYTGVLSLFL